MHVIATAGHVDHGKTSLLRRLTGMEPSRLAEERRRGMTMQLGYVWLPSLAGEGDGLTRADYGPIGIVDVPGHADYRLAMASGASAVDAFLFLCACDDGWMPQSEEHLWTLSAFGITTGVAVLAKSDLVSAERLVELRAELEVRFFEALGREIEVVPFSAVTGEGLEDVRKALSKAMASLPTDVDVGRPHMFVDRVFSVQGHGTVVTGTLRDGSLTDKQRVRILPGNRKAQIRAIHSYGAPVALARPNARVALQVAGLSVEEIGKGAQLVPAGDVFVTKTVDARLRLFPGQAVATSGAHDVLVVHGGVRTPARLLHVADSGGAVDVRLLLESERWLRFGEKILVLSPGADRVIGGGSVVDEDPPRGIRKAADRLPLVRDFDLFEYLTLQMEKRGYARLGELGRRTRFHPSELRALETALPEGFVRLDPVQDWIGEPSRLDAWRNALLARLATFHAAQPSEDGAAETFLIKKMALPAELVRIVVRSAKALGQVTQTGPNLRLTAFRPTVDKAAAAARDLERVATSDEPAAHSLAELGIASADDRRILARFVLEGRLVRLGEAHVMARPVFDDLKERVTALMRERETVSVADARDLLGVGRKLAVLLLEAMDTQRVTVRDGERRRLAATQTLG